MGLRRQCIQKRKMLLLLIFISAIIIALVVFLVLYLRFKKDHNTLIGSIAHATARHLRKVKHQHVQVAII
jgi:hypothetical protein